MEQIERTVKALADGKRLRIAAMLEGKPLCVCEITVVLGIRQPSVSRHLLKLKRAGIIGERPAGLFSEYRLTAVFRRSPLWGAIRQDLLAAPAVRKDVKILRSVDRQFLAGCGREKP